MKIGQEVSYYDPKVGKAQHAVVLEIHEGSGPSLAKALKLRVGTGEDAAELDEVQHGTNAVAGQPFWLIRGLEKAPEGWADHDNPDVPVLAVDDTPGVGSTKNMDEAAAAVRRTTRRESR